MDFLDYREKLGIGFFDEEKFKYFLVNVFNVLNAIADDYSVETITAKEYFDFCNLAGIPIDYDALNNNYTCRERYRHCLATFDRHKSNIQDFLSYYIAFSNSISVKKEGENAWKRENYVSILIKSLEIAHIQFEVLESDKKYFVFPKGAEELDCALVSQPLEWLKDYPKAHETYCTALRQYADGVYIRDVADNLRKALEDFLREFLENEKDLNSNKKVAEQYLKDANANPQLVNMFGSLLTHYYLLNNDIAKHNNKVDKTYLEFLLYQTGVFIRMLIVVKKEAHTHAD